MKERIKRWWDNQDFIKEFLSFCVIITLLMLSVFGPLILASGVIERPAWLLLYIPTFSLFITCYDNY
jgi:hypothetical protein